MLLREVSGGEELARRVAQVVRRSLIMVLREGQLANKEKENRNLGTGVASAEVVRRRRRTRDEPRTGLS